MTDPDTFEPNLGLSRALYLYVWRTSRSKQIAICVLTMSLAPLSAVPLELQRRIFDDALSARNLKLLAILGGIYFAVVCVQGGLKYLLNMVKGMAVETIARDLRLKIVKKARPVKSRSAKKKTDLNDSTVVAMIAAETEDVSGFGGDALGLPLLSAATIAYVGGYLLWVQPAIAVLAMLIYFPQAVIVPVTQHTINRLARVRIQLARNLGQLAIRDDSRMSDRRERPGSILINRIYKVRIWIYLRKYALAALGNFLDSLGPIIVLTVGAYLVMQGKTQISTLVVFISGLAKIADPWDQLINFYRSVSNTAVMYDMINARLKNALTITPRT
jgi:ABC-type multidrug transport system fused ATPase/permease subunit